MSLFDSNPISDTGDGASATMTVPELRVGDPVQVGPVTVFGVFTPDSHVPPAPRRYQTSGYLVDEKHTPSVSNLVMKSTSTVPSLVLDGTLLKGGMQDRMLVGSVLLAPGASAVVEVVCVERDRWHTSGRRDHGTYKSSAPSTIRAAARGASLRRSFDEDLGAGAFMRGSAYTAQPEVWRRVRNMSRRWEATLADSSDGFEAADTSSLIDAMDVAEFAFELDGPAVAPRDVGAAMVSGGASSQALPGLDAPGTPEGFGAGLPAPLPGQRGLIVGFGGEPVMLELFDHADTLEEQFARIVSAALLEAGDSGFEAVPVERAEAFAAQVAGRAIDPRATGPLHGPGAPRRGVEEPRAIGAVAELDLAPEVSARVLADEVGLLHLSALNLAHAAVGSW